MPRTFWLFCALLMSAAAALVFWWTHLPLLNLDDARVIPAKPLHAIIFRYDTEFSSTEQLLELMRQDESLGIVATLFPLTQDFLAQRNTLAELGFYYPDIQLHGRPMPDGLTRADKPFGDRTPYQYHYLGKNDVLRSYVANLATEIAIFAYNGFPVTGLSLHSTHNRLPWSDDINYKLFATAAGQFSLDWVSVTSSAFSIGQNDAQSDPGKFNQFDHDVTIDQPTVWVSTKRGFFSRHETLVIPTSWRDSYDLVVDTNLDSTLATIMTDIDRHWQIARQKGRPLVLLLHPVKYVQRGIADTLFMRLKKNIADRARAEDIPVLTMSEYYRQVRELE